MIIVEGVDNTGKSSLMQQLIDVDPRLHEIPRDRVKPHLQENIGDTYFRMLKGDVRYGIADRFLASECFYGHVLRGGCRISISQHVEILTTLAKIPVLVVLCQPPLGEVERSWFKREQLPTIEQVQTLWTIYDRHIDDLFKGFPLCRFDYTTTTRLDVHNLAIWHQELVDAYDNSRVHSEVSHG